MRVSIGSDHAGFEQKQALVDYLKGKRHEVVDRGPANDDRVDYPDYAAPVARDVAAGAADFGVLVCGTGIGVCIAANKVKGAYAALVNAAEQGDPVDGLGAIGSQNDERLVAEYPGAKPECVVFNKRNCRFTAGIVRTPGDPPGVYTIGETACSGDALLFTLMPLFLDDDEFSEGFKELCEAAKNGYPDLDSASRAAILLCDNVYRRIENHAALRKDGVKVDIPSTGNLSQLTEMAMANNTYAPTAVLYGEFQIFEPGSAPGAPSVVIAHNTFAGQYRMSDRSFSAATDHILNRASLFINPGNTNAKGKCAFPTNTLNHRCHGTVIKISWQVKPRNLTVAL